MCLIPKVLCPKVVIAVKFTSENGTKSCTGVCFLEGKGAQNMHKDWMNLQTHFEQLRTDWWIH